MDIKQIFDEIEKADSRNLNLYFVTRSLKPNTKKSDRILEKYQFKVYQIDIDEDIKRYLYDLSINQFQKIIRDESLIFHDYDVYSDDSEKVFTYPMRNKAMSFCEVITQLKDQPEKITDLNQILANDTLWAYSVDFQIDSEKSIYTFRKVSPGKVGIDEKEESKKKMLGGSLRTLFDTNTNKLKLLKGETVYLDKQIDCIFYSDIFYVLKKAAFEQIVGLQEEYKQEAENLAAVLKNHTYFGDTTLLDIEINTTPSIHKKLFRLNRIGNINNLNYKMLVELDELGKKHGDEISIENNKIVFKTTRDLNNTIKLLCDYYKTGTLSKKTFGTYAGKEIKASD